ncbi:heat-shock protein [bacterium]|nr:heat-shock protein [bacterium]
MTMNGTLTRVDTTNLAKALVGFDRMFDTFESRFAQQMATNYPPHNIIKTSEYNYVIEIAVAGFRKEEISVEVEQEILTVKGEKLEEQPSSFQFLHRGLSSRNFERSWQLAEHMVVKGAEIRDGVLSIRLEYVIPEEKKARVIDIVEVK